MNRREFLNRSTTATVGVGLWARSLIAPLVAESMGAENETGSAVAQGPSESVLSGTAPLTTEGDLAEQMVAGIRRFLLHKTETQETQREQLWNRDYTSVEHYERSVAPKRESLRRMIGVVDTRVAAQAPELVGSLPVPAQIARDPVTRSMRHGGEFSDP